MSFTQESDELSLLAIGWCQQTLSMIFDGAYRWGDTTTSARGLKGVPEPILDKGDEQPLRVSRTRAGQCAAPGHRTYGMYGILLCRQADCTERTTVQRHRIDADVRWDSPRWSVDLVSLRTGGGTAGG